MGYFGGFGDQGVSDEEYTLRTVAENAANALQFLRYTKGCPQEIADAEEKYKIAFLDQQRAAAERMGAHPDWRNQDGTRSKWYGYYQK